MSRGPKKILVLVLFIVLAIGAAYQYDIKNTRSVIEGMFANVSNLDAILLNNKSLALREAKTVFQNELDNGKNFDGACLREELVPGWSFDIVHSPRIEEDSLTANKCTNFENGITQYLIEYDTIGNFVQIKERSKL